LFHGTRWNFENLRPTKCTRDACLFDYDKDARIKKREKKIAKTCHIKHVNEDDWFQVEQPEFTTFKFDLIYWAIEISNRRGGRREILRHLYVKTRS